MELAAMQALVRALLLHANDYEWSLQGLGMLRLYLADGSLRLHIWDDAHADRSASRIHDHPWDFESVVLAGRLANVRYLEDPTGTLFKRVTIRCGEGGCAVAPEDFGRLLEKPAELYGVGARYRQAAAELHDTRADAGTITLIRRTFHDNRDLATVWWKHGPWGSAEPRRATRNEVSLIVDRALIALNYAWNATRL